MEVHATIMSYCRCMILKYPEVRGERFRWLSHRDRMNEDSVANVCEDRLGR